MKEKDLEKHLNNLIIDGLIKEAEQDNAEFEAAMRNMSDEDFLALIYDHVSESTAAASYSIHEDVAEPKYDEYKELIVSNNNLSFTEKELTEHPKIISPKKSRTMPIVAKGVTIDFDEDDKIQPKQRSINWKPWILAIASAAAILMIVLIPAYHIMDSRVCESALLASTTYTTPSKGGDITIMSTDEVKEILHELEMQYKTSMRHHEVESSDNESTKYYDVLADPKETGMELVQAYLKLNKKGKAIEVLKQLSEKYGDSDFGNHCKKMLEILE